MPESDLDQVSSLELMHRISRRLPSNSREAVSLHQVIVGLSAPVFFVPGDRDPALSRPADIARGLLREILPRLIMLLPDDAEVRALAERRDTDLRSP